MYKRIGITLLSLSFVLSACAQGEGEKTGEIPVMKQETKKSEENTGGPQPMAPGKPITPGTPITPGKPIEPGTPIIPGKPITPGTPIKPGKPIDIHLNNSSVKITTDKEQVKLELPDTLLFDYNKSELKAEAKEVLDEISGELKKIESTSVQINGHTDNRGNEKYNLALSDRRAKEVEKYFKNKGYLEHINFSTKGFGESSPAAANDTEENRQKNRRVEIIIKTVNQ
jgi:outer membrane protein OmpA-like peptidoglycan-associated protein